MLLFVRHTVGYYPPELFCVIARILRRAPDARNAEFSAPAVSVVVGAGCDTSKLIAWSARQQKRRELR